MVVFAGRTTFRWAVAVGAVGDDEAEAGWSNFLILSLTLPVPLEMTLWEEGRVGESSTTGAEAERMAGRRALREPGRTGCFGAVPLTLDLRAEGLSRGRETDVAIGLSTKVALLAEVCRPR